jgi:TolA-binding protein
MREWRRTSAAQRFAIAIATCVLVQAGSAAAGRDAVPSEDARRTLTAAGMAFESARLLSGAARVEALQGAQSALDAVLRSPLDDASRGAAALLSGSIHAELGAVEPARAEFERAAGKLRDGAFADDVEFVRIVNLAASGRDTEAAREWTRWEARFPKSPLRPEAQLVQAWVALRLDKPADAEQRLVALAGAEPHLAQDPRVVLARAFAAYRNGRAADALALLGPALTGAEAAYVRGLCHASRGDLIRAAAAFQEVAERSPDSPLRDPALFAKANAFLQARAYRGAAEEFARVRELMQHPQLRAEADLRAAAAVFLSGAADSAATLLSALVEREPDGDVAARAQFLRGEVAHARGQYADAITEYNRVLSRYFEHAVAASAQYRVARCLDALGRRADATGAYRAVVTGYALAPEAPAAAYLAGVGLLELGKPALAAPYFQIVVDRYAAGHAAAGTLVFASPAHQELVEAALCLLELSYHRAGDLGRLSGAPHVLLQRMPPSTSIWRGYALLIDADAQAALGRHADAEATLQRLTREFPAHEIGLAANQLLAWTLAQSGRDSLAVATEERMLARYAAQGDARRLASSFLHVAHVRFNQKRYREAAQGYEDFMRRFPQHGQRHVAAYQAGLAYLRLDRAGDAVDRWESIVRDSATTPIAERAWARAADIYFQAERYADAKRCYQGLLQHFAGSSAAGVASLRLAQCEYNAGRDAEALDAFAAVEAQFPGTPFAREASRGMELALYRLGQKPDGAATLQRLVEQYPTSSFAADAQFEVARRLHVKKEWSAAADAFRRVVVQFPGSPHADRAQLALAECLGKAGRDAEAQAAQEQFLTLFPASPLRASVLFQIASQRFEARDYVQAAVHFTRVVEDSVGADVRAAALFNLAQCQRQLGSSAEARASLARYAKDYAGDERAAQIAYQLGDLDEAAGDAVAALAQYERALTAGAPPALAVELRYRIGRCHELAGDAKAALAAYEKAVTTPDKDDPYRLSALARCASLYEAAGARTRASAAYRDIARHAPDPELAAAAAGKARDLGAARDSEDAAPPVPPARKRTKKSR